MRTPAGAGRRRGAAPPQWGARRGRRRPPGASNRLAAPRPYCTDRSGIVVARPGAAQGPPPPHLLRHKRGPVGFRRLPLFAPCCTPRAAQPHPRPASAPAPPFRCSLSCRPCCHVPTYRPAPPFASLTPPPPRAHLTTPRRPRSPVSALTHCRCRAWGSPRRLLKTRGAPLTLLPLLPAPGTPGPLHASNTAVVT
ncbi:MAG: hypothetical protein J3K34DRAFT_95774 [Monoraphidium minutum]|nr:MAG: hypothetical protein J3K34DRAFT_95774 [Monoraphidium minutum]